MWIKAISKQTGLYKIFNLEKDYAIHWDNINDTWYLFINYKELSQSLCSFLERNDEMFNYIINKIFEQIILEGNISIEPILNNWRKSKDE